MKVINIFICVFFNVYFTSTLFSQTIIVSGNISSNTVWNADTVKVMGDLNVEQNVVLTVNSGTYVEVQGYYKINVIGSIRAIGAINDTVIFTVNDTTNFWQDTISVSGSWAGFFINNTDASTDTSIFEYCKIQFAKKNDVYGGNTNGGAICATNYGNLIVKNSIFKCNMSICSSAGVAGPAGGAIYCKNVNKVLIENNLFESNRSFSEGGAIYINVQCQTIINKNIFIKNKAIQWIYYSGYLFVGGTGGAIATSDDLGYSPTICNNYCFNNVTINGVIYTSNRHGLVFNNVICNNDGNGYFDGHQQSNSRIFNNTIVNNHSMKGDGIQIFSNAKIYNNICWGNVSTFPYPQGDQINVSNAMGGHVLLNNCVQNGYGGDFSISSYPEFISPSLGVGSTFNGMNANWSLSDFSQCINNGTTDTVGLFIPENDIVGSPRIYGGRIDIGCYENQVVTLAVKENDFLVDNYSVFPNPGSSVLNCKSNGTESIFQLSNIIGEIIMQKEIINGINTINTSMLKSGIYFYKLLNVNNDVVGNGKWIKN